ncbi:hypothetical protein [Burkholderia ubonensis]|uniref:hypothetical protein n=1 Tax=Burkholderia ubonensis TaxID=101571 RepID=UPI0009B3DF8C|nr:hypothetical protein [Burkholderia ubonensis]
MSYQEPLSQITVAISISESADMPVLGLAEEHLRDAMAEVARHLLAMGARLAYGGDLRAQGFTELLFELVARHRRDADIGDHRAAVVNYLAWPVHCSVSAEAIQERASNLAGLAEFYCLDVQGNEIASTTRQATPTHAATEGEWAAGLGAMRRKMTDVSNVRVVLGGRVDGFKGRMPGIGEEALCSLEAGKPLFVLGGFGGCARDIAEDLGLVAFRHQLPSQWAERGRFAAFGPDRLRNGLTFEENVILARTVHVDEAVALILRGLFRTVGLERGGPRAAGGG